MNEIRKIMHADFITSTASFGKYPVLVIAILFGIILLIDLFITPCASYIGILFLIAFFIPLQSADDKSILRKLHGILPVRRENITRGRFAYMLVIAFVFEVVLLFFSWLAQTLDLHAVFLPDNSALAQMAADSYNPNSFSCYGMIVFLFAIICLFFTYLEMMGQIFGREKEMKIILITLGVITALGILLGILADQDIIPPMEHDVVDIGFGTAAIISIVTNLFVFGLTVLFGEITARIVSKREL